MLKHAVLLASLTTTQQAFAPPWLVGIGAIVALGFLVLHVRGLWRAEMPDSRRRIRLANGFLMMAATPLAAYALGWVSFSQTRLFTFAWTAITGMVVVIIFLAVADVLNTWRLALGERRKLAPDLAERIRARTGVSDESAGANHRS